MVNFKYTVTLLFLIGNFCFSVQDLSKVLPKAYGDALAGAASASVCGVEALGFNPANLADGKIKFLDLSFAHSSHLSGTIYEFISAKFQLNKQWAFGAGLGYFNSGKINKNSIDSLSLGSDGYYGGYNDGITHLGDSLMILGASYATPWYFNAGINVKLDLSSIENKRSFSSLFDIGLSLRLFELLAPSKPSYSFFVPETVAILFKDLGYSGAYLDENRDDRGNLYRDYHFAFNFVPIISNKSYAPFYTIEFNKSFGPGKVPGFVLATGHKITINQLFNFTILGGYNFVQDGGLRFSSGINVKWAIREKPMEFTYTFKNYRNLGNSHSMNYMIRLDYNETYLPIADMLLYIKRLVVKNEYKAAYELAQRYLKKYPRNEELIRIFEKLKIMLFEQSFIEID